MCVSLCSSESAPRWRLDTINSSDCQSLEESNKWDRLRMHGMVRFPSTRHYRDNPRPRVRRTYYHASNDHLTHTQTYLSFVRFYLVDGGVSCTPSMFTKRAQFIGVECIEFSLSKLFHSPLEPMNAGDNVLPTWCIPPHKEPSHLPGYDATGNGLKTQVC